MCRLRIRRQSISSEISKSWEAPIGMLHLGRLLGWKPFLLIHNRRTVKKNADLLGINFRMAFKDVGDYADKSRAWEFAQDLTNFWSRRMRNALDFSKALIVWRARYNPHSS